MKLQKLKNLMDQKKLKVLLQTLKIGKKLIQLQLLLKKKDMNLKNILKIKLKNFMKILINYIDINNNF